jgi:hypothetical protein
MHVVLCGRGEYLWGLRSWSEMLLFWLGQLSFQVLMEAIGDAWILQMRAAEIE